jgi:hypothetical protein
VGGFIASQPSIAGRALLGKRDLHNATVQPFRRMVGDGCPEILQISAGTAFIATVLLVLTALGPGYLRQHELSPKFFEAPDPIEILLSVGVLDVKVGPVVNENRKHIGDRDFL